jgi:DNA topoisomerase IB/predicted RNA methylase
MPPRFSPDLLEKTMAPVFSAQRTAAAANERAQQEQAAASIDAENSRRLATYQAQDRPTYRDPASGLVTPQHSDEQWTAQQTAATEKERQLAAKAQEAEQRAAARAQQIQQNTVNERIWRAQDRPFATLADGSLAPTHDDTTWKAIQATRLSTAAAAKLKAQEEARQAKFKPEIDTLNLELSANPQRQALPLTERKAIGSDLEQQQDSARNALIQRFTALEKEDPTQAEAAKAKLQKLTTFDAVTGKFPDLEEEDITALQQLAPDLHKNITSRRQQLAADDEARTWRDTAAQRLYDLKKRQLDPAGWEQEQLTKATSLPPEQRQPILDEIGADLTAQQDEILSARDALQQTGQRFQEALSTLDAQNAERRKTGIPGDRLITLANGETWDSELFAQRTAAEDELMKWQTNAESDQEALKQRVESHTARAGRYNATLTTLQQQQQAEQNARETELVARAPELAPILQEQKQRTAELRAKFPGGPSESPAAQAAYDALQQDLSTRITATRQQTAQAGEQLYAKFKDFNRNLDWTNLSTQDAQDLKGFIDKTVAESGLPPEIAKQQIARQKALDWSVPHDPGILEKIGIAIPNPLALFPLLRGDTEQAKKTALVTPTLDDLTLGFFRKEDVAPEQYRVLPGGGLSINPALALNPKAWQAAVDAAPATPEDKAEALKVREVLASELGKQSLPLLQTTSEFPAYVQTQGKKDPGFLALSPEAQAARFMEQAEDRSYSGKVFDQLRVNLGSAVLGILQTVTGTAAIATGSDLARDVTLALAEKTQQNAQQLAAIGASSDAYLRTGGSLVNNATQMVATLGVAGAVGKMASFGSKLATAARLSSGLGDFGSKMAALSRLEAQGISTLSKEGMSTALKVGGGIGEGLQSAAQTYPEAYKHYLAQATAAGMDKEQAKAEAHRNALIPSLMTAASTAVIGYLGGATGAEAILQRNAAQGAKAGFLNMVKAVTKKVGTEAPKEALEEFWQTFADELLAQATYAPDKTSGEIIANVLEGAFQGALLGGGFSALGAVRDQLAAKTQDGQTQDTRGSASGLESTNLVSSVSEPHRLPETVAAAESAIDALQIPNASPAALARTQDAARGALYIAQGTPLEELPASTLAELDLIEDPQNPGQFLNGRIAPGKDGIPTVQEYPAGMAPVINPDGTPGQPRPVRVRMIDGQPVITQATLDKLETLLPDVRAAIGTDERTRINQIKAPKKTQDGQTQDIRPDATLQDSSTVAPPSTAAPAAVNPVNPVNPVSTAPQANPAPSNTQDPAVASRAAELATHLSSLGLSPEDSQAVASHLVAKRGVIGDSYLEQVTDRNFPADLKELGISGALSLTKAKDNPLTAPADLAQRLGNVPETVQPINKAEAPKTKASSATLAQNAAKVVQPINKESVAPANGKPNTANEQPSPDFSDAFMESRQAAMKSTPVDDRGTAIKIIGHLDRHLIRYSPAFPGGIQFISEPTPAGLLVSKNAQGKAMLEVNLSDYLADKLTADTKKLSLLTQAEVEEEVIHAAALAELTDAEVTDLFDSLPQDLQDTVRKARGDTGAGESSFQLGHEFLRMLIQDKTFAGRVSESVAANAGLGAKIVALLQKLAQTLRNLLAAAPAEVRVTVSEYETRVNARLKQILKQLPTTNRAKEQFEAAQRANQNVSNATDARASVVSQTTPPAAQVLRLESTSLGSSGTAFTDSNDAIEYQWAVVNIDDLNISNRDDGTINGDYPQELQPRDRTSAGSESQVADIAKNFNLDRLSHSSSVGDGAPIVGPDGVVESGNGRAMGARRAYTTSNASSKAYRARLAETATTYGLTADQVNAVQNPVLVRIRTTEVNRPAFVLAANVSTIAPKREIEQAKADAKQIVPDLFTSFIPTEDGDIFTPANADFIRGFISAVVPPAERPAVIDARGNLSQAGLRRIRNALFVHAYGTQPEALNALTKLTESIDAADTNLARALVAAAPLLAEQNARIAAGALHDLSISQDLVKAVQTLADLRRRGETIEDWLAQDNIPGIGDAPSALDQDLVRTLYQKRNAPRQLLETLSRYASAVNAAGDPRQMDMFGNDKPDKHTLWNLASNYGNNLETAGIMSAALATAQKRTPMVPATEEDRKRLRIPPAWTDVTVSNDTTAPLQAKGKDAKGRWQSIYSAEHSAAQLAAKFERGKRVHAAMPRLIAATRQGLQEGVEEASVIRLIYLTGFRNGGEGDTGAKVKAYGATTLLGQHVSIEGDVVSFDFTGKLGVEQKHQIQDAGLAQDLGQRKASAGDDGRLFATSPDKVLNYLRSITEADFKVHDLRTWNATALAAGLINAEAAPTTPAEYWLRRDAVADIVAKKLGDTRKIVLESYIDPIVFAKWQESASVSDASDRPKLSKKAVRELGDAGQLSRSNESYVGSLRDQLLPDGFRGGYNGVPAIPGGTGEQRGQLKLFASAKRALSVYRQLSELKSRGATLNPAQNRALDSAEESLGQTFLFDDATTRYSKPADDLRLEQQQTSSGTTDYTQQSLFASRKRAPYPHEEDGAFRSNWKVTAQGQRVRIASTGADGTVSRFGNDKDFDATTADGSTLTGLKSKEVWVALSEDELALEPFFRARLDSFAEMLPDFNATLDAIAGFLPEAYSIKAPLKGAPRALEKSAQTLAESRAKFQAGQITSIPTPEEIMAKMADILRGSILVDSQDQVLSANAAILRAFAHDSALVETRENGEQVYRTADNDVEIILGDRFANPTPAGYSDVQMKIQVAPGHYAELQVHIPEMLAAKEGNEMKEMRDVPQKYHPENLNIPGLNAAIPGHKLFEKARSLPKGNAQRTALDAVMAKLYRSAIDTHALRIAANASSRDTRRTPGSSPVSGGDFTGTAPRGPSTAIFPPETTRGSPSASMKNSGAETGRMEGEALTNYYTSRRAKSQAEPLATSRKRSVSDPDQLDLFAPNTGLGLDTLLTPAQKQAKQQQAVQLDLFNLFDSPTAPAAPSRPRSRPPTPAAPAAEDLFTARPTPATVAEQFGAIEPLAQALIEQPRQPASPGSSFAEWAASFGVEDLMEDPALTEKLRTRYNLLFPNSGLVSDSLDSDVSPDPIPEVTPTALGGDTYAQKAGILAIRVETYLRDGTALDWRTLFAMADQVFAGTQAEGTYNVKDAYDAMEMGFQRWIMSRADKFSVADSMDQELDLDQAHAAIRELKDRMALLPTQTKRTAEMDDLQQFSTVPSLAYMANWVAKVNNTDVMLEPSAGTGGLAVFSKASGATVYANELSSRRASMMRETDLAQEVFEENAEQINNVLPAYVKPTVVVMNPPFSSSPTGVKDTANATKHIESALARLPEGGRLVAIVGEGMAMDRPAFRAWWQKMQQKHSVRANVQVNGQEYAKYGTTWDNQLVVIDKVSPVNPVPPITGRVERVDELPELLYSLRNERPAITRSPAPAPGGTGPARNPTTPSVPRSRPGRGDSQGTDGRAAQPGNQQPGMAGETGASPGTQGGGQDRPGVAGAPGRDDQQGIRPSGTPDGRDVTGGADAGSVNTPTQTAAAASEELTDAVYDAYEPRITFPGALPPPTNLAESAAMSAVDPPTVSYRPAIPPIHYADPARGEFDQRLADHALEAITLAGHAHQQTIPASVMDARTKEDWEKRFGTKPPETYRRGFFIGDGTGAGKGRQVAGIMFDNWNQGRKRAIWVSETNLLNDARRDLNDVADLGEKLFEVNATKAGEKLQRQDGIGFISYSTLRSQEMKPEAGKLPKTRVDQIVEWLGADFDGVIAFDEAHNMGSAMPTKGSRGDKEASKQALAGLELQARLPNARVVYLSATGATEVSNLAYAERLGLWGPGTPFRDRAKFVTDISSGGVAAMELIAQNLKAMGLYVSRSISWHDVSYERLTHTLSTEQRQIYDDLAEAWQGVLKNMDAALKVTGVVEEDPETGADKTKNSDAKSAMRSRFWGGHQRFFNQLITAVKLPTVIDSIEKERAAGRSIVIQLVNTQEASLGRAISKAAANAADAGEEMDLESLDLSPRDMLLQLVQNSFPVIQQEDFQVADSEGNSRTYSRAAKDSSGNVILNQEAVAMREALLDKLSSITVPSGPLEMLIDHFGAENVAEVTGRTRRVVWKKDKAGQTIRSIEKRTPENGKREASDFQNGERKILIFSKAGGTGRSFHADRRAKNQDKRVHILLQPGWQASAAVQGLGRTHRNNQVTAPHVALADSDIVGEKRFMSSIARRLDQLGALTKGQRQTGSQGIFQAADNLESDEARAALAQFYQDALNNKIDDLRADVLEDQMGLTMRDKDGNVLDNLPPIQQFLNRLLSLKLNTQDTVFNAFSERLDKIVETKLSQGTLDQGLENLTGLTTVETARETVYSDPKSTAKAELVTLELTKPTNITEWSTVKALVERADEYYPWVKSRRTGKAFGLTGRRNVTLKDGRVEQAVRIHGVTRSEWVPMGKLWERYERITDAEEAQQQWETEFKTAPASEPETVHVLTGTMLPIWDKIPGSPRIVRAQTTDTNRRMIGRVVPSGLVPAMVEQLTGRAAVISPEDALASLPARLANGWRLKSSYVSGQERIEILGPDYNAHTLLDNAGVLKERIQFQMRYFLPKGNAPAVLGKVLESFRTTVQPQALATAAKRNVPALDAAANQAATSPDNATPEPTEAQKRAGNYTLGHVKVGPMDLSIENPAGSIRKGTSRSGKTWETPMHLHYGYLKGTKGRDGDHIDIFLSPGTPTDYDGPVYVINQHNPDGQFDEHKAVTGPNINTPADALAAYLINYQDGWKGGKSIGRFNTVSDFHTWATSASQRRAPASGMWNNPVEISPTARQAAEKAKPTFRFSGLDSSPSRATLPNSGIRNPESEISYDPFTGHRTHITGSRLTAAQGQAIALAHVQRLRGQSGTGQSSPQTAGSPQQGISRAPLAGPPTLTEEQFEFIRQLPEIGGGAEATVYADESQGVVYKVLEDWKKRPILGIWGEPQTTASGKLDWRFKPATTPRQLSIRLAVQGLLGGTPTEIAGISPEGHIILKQPLSPAPSVPSDLSDPLSSSGIIPIPQSLLHDDGTNLPAYLVHVEGRPWLLLDVRPDNFVGDNQGQARANDLVVGQITPDLLQKVPGLAQTAQQAQQAANQLGDRSERLFTARKSAITPAQDAEYLAAVEAGNLPTAQRLLDNAADQSGLVKLTFTEDQVPTAYYKRTTHPLWRLRRTEDADRKEDSGEWQDFIEELNGANLKYVDPIVTIEYEDTPGAFFVEDGNHRVRVWQDVLQLPDESEINALTFFDESDVTYDEEGNPIPLTQRFPEALATAAKRGTRNTEPEQTASPLAKLGFNHLDRALSAKIAAHTRWLKDSVSETVSAWTQTPHGAPVARLAKLLQRELFPATVLPREVEAKKREMSVKTAMGAQRSMDLVRALTGNPKFSDIAYPPEFAANPMHRRHLYEAMTGAREIATLPKPLQALAEKLRGMLVDIGQEAVKQGRMSLDTFENLRTTYMPHYYKEDVQREKSLFHAFRLGVRDILAQRTTAWHMVDADNLDPVTKEPRLVSHTGNQWRFRNKEHLNAFYEDFIQQEALKTIQGRGKQFKDLSLADLQAPAKLDAETRGRLAEIRRDLRKRYRQQSPLSLQQQEDAGLIMDPVYAIARYAVQMSHDNATAEWFNFVARNPDWTSDAPSPGFTQIPDNPRFGRLSGKHVTDDIAMQVTELVDSPHAAIRLYDTLLGWWKTGKTVLNPGTHVRNVLGNIMFSQLSGNNVLNPGNATYYKQALKALREGGAILTESYDQGVLGGDFVSAELRQHLRALLPDPQTINEEDPTGLLAIGKRIGQVLPDWAKNPVSKGYNKITDLYQAEDEVFKLAAYLKAKSMGMAPTEAAAHIRKWFAYYDGGNSTTLKAVGRTAMPFLSFYRESIRIFGHALKERPLALAASLTIPSVLTALSAMALGLDDDELDQVQKDMRGKAGKLLGPTPLGDKPLFSVLLPARTSNGDLQQWDLSSVYPFTSFLGTGVETASGDWWQNTWRSLISAGPLGNLAYSQATGRDAFGDRPFVEQNMTAGEKLAARAGNAWKTLAPPLAPGGTGFATLENAGERSTNKSFELRSPTQAVARAIGGVDIRSANPDIYRIAEDWRAANGLPTTEGMDFSGTTPQSRARKLLFGLLAQDEPNMTSLKNLLTNMDKMGIPVKGPQDLQRLLFYKDPRMIISGKQNQDRFRASLQGEEKRMLETAIQTYEKIKSRAPALLAQARTSV